MESRKPTDSGNAWRSPIKRYVLESIYSIGEKLLFNDRPCQIAATTPIVRLDRKPVLSVDTRRDFMCALLPYNDLFQRRHDGAARCNHETF